MKIGIVGAGWAGLSAAVRLKQFGHSVTVFEASDTPGGRARRVIDPKLGNIDNGQHLMLGAYTQTLALIQALNPNVPSDKLLRRSALKLDSLDGKFLMKAGNTTSALSLFCALLFAKGLGFTDKWHAITMLARLKRAAWACPHDWSVDKLLTQYRQTPATCRWLWHPLCLSAMNTPIKEASAQVFLNVLKDSFDADPSHADLIVPRLDLSALWPDAAAAGVDMRWRHVVRQVLAKDKDVEVDGESFDYAVIATPPFAASRMLAAADTTVSTNTTSADTDFKQANGVEPAMNLKRRVDLKKTIDLEHSIDIEPPTDRSFALDALRNLLNRFTYVPITNITLGLAAPWDVHGQIWMLDEQASQGHVGQWLFVSESGKELRIVISTPSDRVLNMDHATLAKLVYDQVNATNAQTGNRRASPLPPLEHFRVLTEKRATFACTPSLQRPSNQTPWPRLMLAGDWTNGPYPAVLEAAVRSGKHAAELIQACQPENTPDA